MSWKCSCGVINNGLNSSCTGQNQAILNYFDKHEPVSYNSCDELLDWVNTSEVRIMADVITLPPEGSGREMTEREKSYVAFYNKKRLEVAAMDIVALREEIEDLQDICFEARTYLKAATDEDRERTAKLRQDKKEWLVPNKEYEPEVSDAINVVATRKARMTKIEKLAESMKALGVSDEDIKKMTNQISRSATDENVNKVTQFTPKLVKKVETPTEPNTQTSTIDTQATDKQVEKKPFNMDEGW